jgi:hypothetical protein
MGEVTTIGLDLAKHVFQVHGQPAAALSGWPGGLGRYRGSDGSAQVLTFFRPTMRQRLASVITGGGSCARLATRCV